jgi:hypothetical protein
MLLLLLLVLQRACLRLLGHSLRRRLVLPGPAVRLALLLGLLLGLHWRRRLSPLLLMLLMMMLMLCELLLLLHELLLLRKLLRHSGVTPAHLLLVVQGLRVGLLVPVAVALCGRAPRRHVHVRRVLL